MKSTGQALTSTERSRRYREKNAERLRAEARARYQRSADEWNLRKREARANDPEPIRAYDRIAARKRYASQCPEERKKRNKQHWIDNGKKIGAAKRDKKYGLAEGQYDSMLLSQNGACLICAKTPKEAGCTFLAVDHCHKSGKVRGLLCRQCNLDIAFIERRGHLYQRMTEYLDGRLDADDQLSACQAVIREYTAQ